MYILTTILYIDPYKTYHYDISIFSRCSYARLNNNVVIVCVVREKKIHFSQNITR